MTVGTYGELLACNNTKSVKEFGESLLSGQKVIDRLRSSFKRSHIAFSEDMFVGNYYIKKLSGDNARVEKFLRRETLSKSETVARKLQMLKALCPAVDEIVDGFIDEFNYQS